MVMVDFYSLRKSKALVDYIEDFFYEHKANSLRTHKTYLSNINLIVKDIFDYDNILKVSKRELENLDVHVLKKYFKDLHSKVDANGERVFSNGTINDRMSAITTLLKYLSAHEIIDIKTEQFTLLKRYKNDSKEGEMIPLEMALKYADYFLEERDNKLDKHYFMILGLETAFRAEELLSLEWSQFVVDGDEVIIKSSETIKGKGNKDYADKISLELYNELLCLKKEGSSKVFNLKYRTVSNMMNRANDHFGNENRDYTPHSIRRTAVTMVYRLTGCIVQAQNKARHSTIETTRRYLRIEDIGITGVISIMKASDSDLYSKVDNEQLVKALADLPLDVKILVNNKLKNM